MLAYKKILNIAEKKFVTKFVTRITNFVTCVRNFVTCITNFVTNFPYVMVKNIKGLGKNSSEIVKSLRRLVARVSVQAAAAWRNNSR